MMHTIISDECSGCDLCVPACPVDCITMVEDPNQDWDEERRARAKMRFGNHIGRRDAEKREREERLARQTELLKKVRSAGASENADSNSYIREENKADLITRIMNKAKK